MRSQFVIGRTLTEEPNKIICMASIENQRGESLQREMDDQGNKADIRLNMGSGSG